MRARRARRCIICRQRAMGWFCAPCARSYDRANVRDATMIGLIEWAAKRTRRLMWRDP
jgi:hypothetical protein